MSHAHFEIIEEIFVATLGQGCKGPRGRKGDQDTISNGAIVNAVRAFNVNYHGKRDGRLGIQG